MKQWHVKNLQKNLPNLPEYPSLIVRLLALRGLTESEAIRDFLDPDYEKLNSPFLFLQMQKAVERIEVAIKNQEKITIYSDYDADAITAASVVYLGLKKLGIVADCYIPDRFTEGYGVNADAIKLIAEKTLKENADKRGLIITVDCGTNAVEEAEACKQLGIDLIITDHHELTGPLPQALALINPKNPADAYPFPFLTGVGVAFKLVQALFADDRYQITDNKIPVGWHKWLLDLVAIGTVADCQSLSGENRILVSFGLKVLAKTRWVGLKALLSTAALKSAKFDTFTLGFIIAPRINAAGRIKHADVAFKLLIEENPTQAEKLADELNELNKHRQMLTDQILSEARSQVELIADKKVLLVQGLDWPKGVVGLVAGRLAEEYNRPVLAVSSSADGTATGSARSNTKFDMVTALTFAKEHLQKYGGHTQAAGFSLSSDKIESFHQKLLEHAESLDFAISDPTLEIDAELNPADITWENYGYIEAFAPFGYGNPKPKFSGKDFEVLDFRTVGTNNQHMKLKLGFGAHRLSAIVFNQGFLNQSLSIGRKLDAVFELTSNEWNGNKELELKVIDTKLHD